MCPWNSVPTACCCGFTGIAHTLRAGLAKAPVQYGLCREEPRAGRGVFIIHDLDEGPDRGLAGAAGQGRDVFWDVVFNRHHGSRVTDGLGRINRMARRCGDYKVS